MKHLILVTLAAAALVVPASAADAAAPTCQGKRATIVGDPDKALVKGTERRDVIVSNGVGAVRARGGDDLICVTGGFAAVQDGPGNDVVDARRVPAGQGVFADLAGGNDTFVGGPGRDNVRLKGGGRDRIATGGGVDSVEVRRTSTGSRIDLGAGNDLVIARNAAGAFVEGGSGVDVLELDDSRLSAQQRYVIDNRLGRARRAGTQILSWRSIQRFAVQVPDRSRVRFLGSARSERLELEHLGFDGTRTVALDMGGGADQATINGIDRGSVRMGTGRDKLRIDSTQSVDVDLAAGTVDTIRPNDLGTTHLDISGVDDLGITRVPFIDVTGDGDDNTLTAVNTCTSVVRGGGGDDTIDVNATNCTTAVVPRHSLHGDGGDDDLTGTDLDDLLDGGAGTDVADGLGGTDVCTAETTKNCEA